MEKLKTWRETQHQPLTLEEAAKLVGVTKATWQRWEAGTRKIGICNISLVSQCTGIPRDELRPELYSGEPQ